MKKTTTIDHEAVAKAKGRRISAIIHMAFLALLAFPFLQMVAPPTPQDVKIVMDFSSGSRAEGAKSKKTVTSTPKSIATPKSQKTKPVQATVLEESVHIEETTDIETQNKEPEMATVEEIETEIIDAEETADESGAGAGENGNGDAAQGSASSGNGHGFIEGEGALTRAVIDRGDTKKLAQENGTLILKICINRRGIVTFAEWDKEGSTIKDSSVARTALDNVLDYRFETDRGAPSKECGRLTYIIDVN